jgi:hypothetical protein
MSKHVASSFAGRAAVRLLWVPKPLRRLQSKRNEEGGIRMEQGCERGRKLRDDLDEAISKMDVNVANVRDTFNTHIRTCTVCESDPPQGKFYKPQPTA